MCKTLNVFEAIWMYLKQSGSVRVLVCNADPTAYCNNQTITIPQDRSVCEADKIWRCKLNHIFRDFEYQFCLFNPQFYCTNDVSHYQDHDLSECKHVVFPGYAIMLLVPFTLNYVVSFLNWSRIEKSKRISIIFPLLNLFSPSGKSKAILLSL